MVRLNLAFRTHVKEKLLEIATVPGSKDGTKYCNSSERVFSLRSIEINGK